MDGTLTAKSAFGLQVPANGNPRRRAECFTSLGRPTTGSRCSSLTRTCFITVITPRRTTIANSRSFRSSVPKMPAAQAASSSLKPFARAAFQWVKQAIVQWGWRDGRAGLRVAKWSAVAAFWKWNLVKAARLIALGRAWPSFAQTHWVTTF